MTPVSIRYCAFRLVVVWLVFLNGTTPVPARQDGEPDVNLSAEVVIVPFTPRDAKGKIVDNLTEKDFVVLDDGQEQEIAFFERDTAPLDVLLLLDTSASTGATLDVISASALTFIKQLRKGDSFAVMTFSEKPEGVLGWTSDERAARTALATLSARGNTYLYLSAEVAIRSMFDSRPRTNRRALVVLTDGLDINAGYFTPRRTAETALSRDVTLYVVSVNRIADDIVTRMFKENRIAEARRGDYEEMQRSLRDVEPILAELAGTTGGRVVFPTRGGDLAKAYEQIAEELRSRYVLGFYGSEQAKDGFHKITVTAKQPGVEVRARSGYFKVRRIAPSSVDVEPNRDRCGTFPIKGG